MSTKKELPKIPKSFFRDNQVAEMSAAVIADFALTLDDPAISDSTTALLEEYTPEQVEENHKMREMLESLETPEEIVEFMRKCKKPVLRKDIVKKVLPIQDKVMPFIFRRFKTSSFDYYLESCFSIFCRCDEKYIRELYNMYYDIRCPYAQAIACLAFGEQDFTESVERLLDEYYRLQVEYPDESYSEYPLLALHLIYEA